MADKDKQKSVQDLMAGQPGAQSLEVALENIRARRKRLLGDEIATAPTADTIQPEPIPIIDAPDDFAADFWKRQQEKPKKPKTPKGRPTKAPHLTVHEGKEPPKK